MTTIAAGATGTYTFIAPSNVSIDLGANERAIVTVLSSAGKRLYGDRLSSSRVIGPFPAAAVMSITADGAAIDYAVMPAQATASVQSYTGEGAAPLTTSGYVPALLRTVSTSGDSFTARQHQAYIPSGATVSGGVATWTVASHGLSSGSLFNVTGCSNETYNVVRAPITRIDINSFSFPCPGAPDGLMAGDVAVLQGTAWSQNTLEGVTTYLRRYAGGGIELVQNGGMSGYRTQGILDRYETALRPFASGLHIHWGYFNDLNFGVTVEASTATVQEILLKRKAQGSLCVCISAIPFPSGVYTWTTLTAPLVTLTDATAAQWINRWNRVMREFCLANGMFFTDIFTLSVDPTTGYAKSGVCKGTTDIHPSALSNKRAAKLINAYIGNRFQPRQLAVSTFDTIASDSSSKNIVRNLPTSDRGVGGGANGSLIVASYTAWAASVTVGAIPSNRFRTNVGQLYMTLNASAFAPATAPTHTSGTVTGADGITWTWVGEASGTAGIPASMTVALTNTALAHCSIITLPDGTQALRVIVQASADNEQLRVTDNLTVGDIAAGNTLNAAMRVSLLTAIAAASKTPAGQNVKAFTAQLSMTVAGVAYIAYEATGGVASQAEQLDEDIDGQTFTVDGFVVPAGTLTVPQFDLIQQFSGAGLTVTYVGCGTVTKA